MREEASNTSEELPKRMQNAPRLHLGSALYFNAWYDLDLERDRSKLERIKRSSCFEYAYDYDFTEEQTEDLWYYIQRMDREFLKWWQSKQPKPRKTGRNGRTVERGNAE
jgi:hypothetical protein